MKVENRMLPSRSKGADCLSLGIHWLKNQHRKPPVVRELIKGWLGETMTGFGIWLKLDHRVYRRVHNIILSDARNHTTQIDHVLVSIYGLFVIETKNMGGWIFGSAEQEMWTQQLFKKRFKF